MDSLNPRGVLCSQGSNGTHAVAAQQSDRFQIGLNSRPTSGIRSGDCQHPFHVNDLISFERWNVIPHVAIKFSPGGKVYQFHSSGALRAGPETPPPTPVGLPPPPNTGRGRPNPSAFIHGHPPPEEDS